MPETVAASIKPPVLQGDVIALYTQGTSKRSIAKELRIDRATVDRIIRAYGQDKPESASRVRTLIPKAYDAVDKALTRGDARIAMDLLKVTDLAPQVPTQYRVEGDMHVSQAVNLLPAAPATPGTAITTDTTGTAQVTGATEAAANPPVVDIGLSNLTNFSHFSTAQLETELARRRAAPAPGDIIDAEIVR